MCLVTVTFLSGPQGHHAKCECGKLPSGAGGPSQHTLPGCSWSRRQRVRKMRLTANPPACHQTPALPSPQGSPSSPAFRHRWDSHGVILISEDSSLTSFFIILSLMGREDLRGEICVRKGEPEGSRCEVLMRPFSLPSRRLWMGDHEHRCMAASGHCPPAPAWHPLSSQDTFNKAS